MSDFTETLDEDTKQSSFALRHMIDELKHQCFHLERSNRELADALEADPGDKDFLDAIDENRSIIIQKKHKIRSLLEQLEQCDPAYRQQVFDQLQLDSIPEDTYIPDNGNPASPLEIYDANHVRLVDAERAILSSLAPDGDENGKVDETEENEKVETTEETEQESREGQQNGVYL
jgi:hypothetical protein